jgi:hypothetical protein
MRTPTPSDLMASPVFAIATVAITRAVLYVR